MNKHWLMLHLLAGIVLASAAPAAQVPVYNTNDALAGSLRQAIQDAAPGDTIVFQIPTTDPNYDTTTGIWYVTLTSAPVTIAKNLTIDGGSSKIAIYRSGSAPLFRIMNVTAPATVVLSRLTIRNGYLASSSGELGGGGIFSTGNLTLKDCALFENTASCGSVCFGGAVYNSGGTLTVLNSTLTRNGVNGGPGYGTGISNSGTLIVRHSTISGNLFVFSGVAVGGIYNGSGSATIGSSIIASNSGDADVGGAFISEGYNLLGTTTGSSGFGATGDQLGASAAQVNLSALRDNGGPTRTMRPLAGSVAIDQGKRALDPAGQPLSLDQRGYPRPVDLAGTPNAVGGDGSDIGAVETGAAQSGPDFVVTNTGYRNDGCTTDDCTLLEAINAANANGDANVIRFAFGLGPATELPSSASTALYSITGPVSILGPGARQLSINGGNLARVLTVSSANVALSGVTLTNGLPSVGFDGGAIHNSGGLTLTDCTIKNSVVAGDSGGGNGGGLFNASGASATLLRCTFNNNLSQQGFGGGAIFNSGTLTATNCTITGNSAPSGGGILAVSNNGNSLTTLRNCTITNNTATSTGSSTAGGGGYYGEGGVGNTLHHFSNTILAGNINSVNPDLRGYGTSEGNNLVGNLGAIGSGFSNGVNGDKVGVNPGLGTFTNNGGPTDTWSLLSNSPAVNAGNNGLAPPTDQRAYPRIGTSDIGAFEFGSGGLRITGIRRSGSDMVIDFAETVANISYRLERKSEMTDASWQPINGLADLTATATGSAQIIHMGGAGPGKGFYRVRQLP